MMKNIFLIFITVTIIILLAQNSYAVDILNLADQSTLRCSGGIIATGDSDRAVLQKCGEPLDVQAKQDYGAVWIYHPGQSKFMYYLGFQNGRLQRIVSAPCNSNDYECYDLR